MLLPSSSSTERPLVDSERVPSIWLDLRLFEDLGAVPADVEVRMVS